MAELTPQERLQPSLLDRLTDDEPDKKLESREQRVLSTRRLRQSVLRDIAWLLNTVSLEAAQDLEAYPEAVKSVINFGIQDLSGHTISTTNISDLEAGITRAILLFEPRILPHTLKVRTHATDDFSHNAISFDIEGDLWMQPLPLRLFLKTEVDLETGFVDVVEQLG